MIAAIALGSNLESWYGDPAANLREAVRRLEDLGRVTAVSSFYETEPVGYTDQPLFTNAAAMLESDLGPLDLMRALLRIEEAMGRVRAADVAPKGPRVVDLDLLLYEGEEGGSLILKDPDLTLPHPELHRRGFVLKPLAEIAPGMRHPVLGRSVAELWRDCEAAEDLGRGGCNAGHDLHHGG